MAENNTKRGPGHDPGGPRGGFRKPKDLRGTLSKLMGYLGQYKALVESSKISTFGFFKIARAMHSRCFCPPETLTPPCPRSVSRPSGIRSRNSSAQS